MISSSYNDYLNKDESVVDSMLAVFDFSQKNGMESPQSF